MNRLRSALSLRRKPKPATQAVDSFQIPRTAFVWLLMSVTAVILPHALRLPLWLIAICALCIAGRVLIWQGRMSQPGKRLKMVMVLLMAVFIVVQFGRNVVSTDATVGVLLVGITLKLLEMYRRRDILAVLYLCYFTLVAEFIYSQSIPVALYSVLVAAVITSALISLNQNEDSQRPWRTFKLAATMLAQSVPLMAAFFLLFPRISPLWSVPLQSRNGVTGLSESMAPGDIGQLARSAELAFRVKFTGEAPNYSELYWRALTLDEFNGRQWIHGYPLDMQQFLGPNATEVRAWFKDIQYLGHEAQYNVILEPTYRNWIYTLAMPQLRDDRMLMGRDYQVGTIRPITQRYNYDASSWLDYRADASDEGLSQRRARRVPGDSNARSKQFAADLRKTVQSDEDYIQAVLNNFRKEKFFYTLSPRTLGDNPVDEFLFDTREGFCEHYASSFTFLMRAAGIPARVVTGYMGGEYNPYDATLTVRQYDAHAWSEVWIRGKGWLRVDPTAAVAPQRVTQGSNFALKQEKEFMNDEGFSLMRFRDSQLLNDLRLQLEMMDYKWNRFVLNYNQEQQFQLFNKIFGTVTRLKIVLSMFGFMACITLFVVLVIFRKSAQAKLPPATRHYLDFCEYMAGLGFPRQRGEPPLKYLERMSEQHPQWRSEVEAITKEFVHLAYKTKEPDPLILRNFRRHVRRIRLFG
jgi:transglutaminase-like putative cysteine protease